MRVVLVAGVVAAPVLVRDLVDGSAVWCVEYALGRVHLDAVREELGRAPGGMGGDVATRGPLVRQILRGTHIS